MIALKRDFNLLHWVAYCLAMSSFALAQSQIDFSGDYTTTGNVRKHGASHSVTNHLHITQTADSIRMETNNTDGWSNGQLLRLDGSEGPCTLPGGVSARCKAKLKGDTLTVETNVPNPFETNAPHTLIVDKWKLAKDGSHLRHESSGNLAGSHDMPLQSWSNTYLRVDSSSDKK